jgi:ADP-heptose:LPS heptosyltransferase
MRRLSCCSRPIQARLGFEPRRIAVFRALKLGDMLCAVPALRALRAALLGSEIALVGLPWAREFADRFRSYVDDFHEFPGWPGLPEQPPQGSRLPRFLARMCAERFDLILQLHGSGEVTNQVVAQFGARRIAGCYKFGAACPDPELFMPYPDQGLEVHRLLELLEYLGIPARGDQLEFPVRPSDRAALANLPMARHLRPGAYVCLHPGASVPERRWTIEGFASVAQSLTARGLRVVLTGSTAEAELTARVAQASGLACLDLAGRTDLGVMAALLRHARLVVCNDTGVSHLAAALRVPSVVLSTGDNPARWAPADRLRHRVLRADRHVTAAQVMEQVDELDMAFAHTAPRHLALAGA